MAFDFFPLLRPALLALDAERAHGLTIKALEAGIYPRPCGPDDMRLRQSLFGLDFPNPLGMAAGFDKDARVMQALLALGFGFAEVGTVTPLPQEGNPKPRLFRLPADGAVINRMGFNNEGLDAVLPRLKARPGRGIVGVNLGANKTSKDKIADYVTGVRAVQELADYMVINISSPNTPGLRNLQAGAELDALLGQVMAARHCQTPLLVKIAPDLDSRALHEIAAVIVAHGVDGVIVSNTTLSREGLRERAAAESGGMSGAPLFKLSTRILARMYMETRGRVPLIGVGGISSGADAYDKIRAGASLVQLYTALVYQGPGLITRIKRELGALLEKNDIRTISQVTGKDAEAIAQDI
jgi:dihydroorotate dehydrogenase